MMIALEGAFLNVVDGIVIQLQRSQIAQKMKTGVADLAQVIIT